MHPIKIVLFVIILCYICSLLTSHTLLLLKLYEPEINQNNIFVKKFSNYRVEKSKYGFILQFDKEPGPGGYLYLSYEVIYNKISYKSHRLFKMTHYDITITIYVPFNTKQIQFNGNDGHGNTYKDLLILYNLKQSNIDWQQNLAQIAYYPQCVYSIYLNMYYWNMKTDFINHNGSVTKISKIVKNYYDYSGKLHYTTLDIPNNTVEINVEGDCIAPFGSVYYYGSFLK